MIRLRPALWPTLISLPILVLSLSLGVWQMERREWKRDILDRLTTNQAAAPMPLDDLLRGDPLRHEYGRVKIAGSFVRRYESVTMPPETARFALAASSVFGITPIPTTTVSAVSTVPSGSTALVSLTPWTAVFSWISTP